MAVRAGKKSSESGTLRRLLVGSGIDDKEDGARRAVSAAGLILANATGERRVFASFSSRWLSDLCGNRCDLLQATDLTATRSPSCTGLTSLTLRVTSA